MADTGFTCSDRGEKEEALEILEASNTEEPLSLDFQPNETIGLLTVPKLKKDIPIIEGTDEEQLAAGVGHYLGTAFPPKGIRLFCPAIVILSSGNLINWSWRYLHCKTSLWRVFLRNL